MIPVSTVLLVGLVVPVVMVVWLVQYQVTAVPVERAVLGVPAGLAARALMARRLSMAEMVGPAGLPERVVPAGPVVWVEIRRMALVGPAGLLVLAAAVGLTGLLGLVHRQSLGSVVMVGLVGLLGLAGLVVSGARAAHRVLPPAVLAGLAGPAGTLATAALGGRATSVQSTVLVVLAGPVLPVVMAEPVGLVVRRISAVAAKAELVVPGATAGKAVPGARAPMLRLQLLGPPAGLVAAAARGVTVVLAARPCPVPVAPAGPVGLAVTRVSRALAGKAPRARLRVA